MEFYTWAPDSFVKKLSDGVVKAANDDDFSEFRIQCMLADIQYRSFASNKYVTWLFRNKSAFRILIEIMKEAFKREREGKPSIFNWHKFVCNVFALSGNSGLEIVEEILNAFKDEFSDAERRIAEYMKETGFVDRTYGTYFDEIETNLLYGPSVYDVFEDVFPGANLFPSPTGSWTDPRDGKTYETRRWRDKEFIRAPVGEMMIIKDIINNPDCIPDGWRLPYEDELMNVIKYNVTLDHEKVFHPNRTGLRYGNKKEWVWYFPVMRDNQDEDICLNGCTDIGPNGRTWLDEVTHWRRRKVSIILCRDV